MRVRACRTAQRLRRLARLVAAVALLAAAAPAPAAAWSGDAGRALGGLARAVSAGRLAEIEAQEYRRDVAEAVRAIRGGGGSAVAAALADVAAQAGSYDRPRALSLFTTLRLNTTLVREGGMPRVGRNTRDADGVAFRAVPSGGVRFHPLASFGNLNREAKEGSFAGTIRLAYALLARARSEGDTLVWEYTWATQGGSPPWISGMAQAVAAQALARSGFHEEARRAYRPIPRRLLLNLPQGPWIRLYGFNGLTVLNAQLQAALSIEEYGVRTKDAAARKLASRMRAAAAELMPRFDTGSWTLYSLGGAESTLEYHTYVSSLLWKLSARTGDRRWVPWAAKLRDQWRKPPYVSAGPPSPVAVPVPAEGFRDWAQIRFGLSKPARVTVRVAGERIVRRLGAGDQVLWWAPGARRPGSYDVHIRAVDRAGNTIRRKLPPVRVERDTDAPRLAATLGAKRVTWRAHDPGTPWLSVRVLAERGGAVVERRLPRRKLRGAVPLGLDLDVRWHVTVVAADSSGNVARVRLGQIGGQGRLPRA